MCFFFFFSSSSSSIAILVFVSLTIQAISAFTIAPTCIGRSGSARSDYGTESTSSPFLALSSSSSPNEMDVSDLGLTMDDLNAPLPSELLRGIETTGYDSTSRISTVQDDACMWTESPESMKATLAIPGLRGQPSMCLSVLTSTNTISVTAFGRVVWSCILRGTVKPDTAVFDCKDGADMIPIIEYEVKKDNSSAGDPTDDERWGGFILQIGEDSIL